MPQNYRITYTEALSKEFKTFYKYISDKRRIGENWEKNAYTKNLYTKKILKKENWKNLKVKKILFKYSTHK